MRKSAGFWNFENCKGDALNYVTKKEWRNKSYSAYVIALKNKWLEECCKHMELLGSKYKRLIYAFEFPDKYVYVGLTYNIDSRRIRHLVDTKSQVFKHIKLIGLEPTIKKLTDYLDVTDASNKEGEFVNQYIVDGWKILNSIKTGGLGGTVLKWTKQNCIVDALKFTKRIDWSKGSAGAYDAAFNNGWIDECCKHMKIIKKPNGYWTKEKCICDALNFMKNSEWRKYSNGSYDVASKNGWLSECRAHMYLRKYKT